MTWRLLCAKPLSEPKLDYCQLDPTYFSETFNQNANFSTEGNAFENVGCEMAAILSQPQGVNYTLKQGSNEHHLWATFLTS